MVPPCKQASVCNIYMEVEEKYVPHSFYGKQKTKDNFSTLEIVLLNRHSLKIITTSSVLLTI